MTSAAFDLLADSRRRTVLYHFASSELGSIEELTRKVAASERDVPVEEVPEEAREAAGVSLIHAHLPKLEAHGVVEYDSRSGDVVRSDAYESIRPFVERARALEEGEKTPVRSSPTQE